MPGAQPASAAAERVRLGGVLLEALPRRHRRSLRAKGVLPPHHPEGKTQTILLDLAILNALIGYCFADFGTTLTE